jgi:very-short-patch-repair endonuclease
VEISLYEIEESISILLRDNFSGRSLVNFCNEKKLLNLKKKEYEKSIQWCSDAGRGKRSWFFSKLNELSEEEKEKNLIIFCEEILNRFGSQIDAEESPYHIEHISRLKQFLNQNGQEIDLKFLIFAAKGPKPAIFFKNFLSLEGLEIVERGGDHLLFKGETGRKSLTYSNLLTWWITTQFGYTNQIPKEIWNKQWEALKDRLRSSCDYGSKYNYETILMDTYFSMLSDYNNDLPALIPQAYYQWITTSQKKLGQDYPLDAQKMDFIIFFPKKRVNIEIDGIQHYADKDSNQNHWVARPKKYEKMVIEDRRKSLLGWEIYRFGGSEFHDKGKAIIMLKDFFRSLLRKYEDDSFNLGSNVPF